MDLIVNRRVVSDVVILDMTGRLWILDLPLRDLVRSLLEDGSRYFVLNLTNLHYLDSSGLGQMVSIWSSIKNKGGYMTVLRPSERVRRLLEITRLQSVFEIFDEEATAVAMAGNSSRRSAAGAS